MARDLCYAISAMGVIELVILGGVVVYPDAVLNLAYDWSGHVIGMICVIAVLALFTASTVYVVVHCVRALFSRWNAPGAYYASLAIALAGLSFMATFIIHLGLGDGHRTLARVYAVLASLCTIALGSLWILSRFILHGLLDCNALIDRLKKA